MSTPKDDTINLIRLGRKLQHVSGLLEDWEHVDRDLSWVGKKPPKRIRRGATYAIQNVRSVVSLIWEAERIADCLPKEPLRLEARQALQMAFDAIGQADVIADFAMQQGDHREAVDCVRVGMRRAHEKAGAWLDRLAVGLLVWAEEFESQASSAAAKPRRRGRKPASAEAKARDERIHDAWMSGRYTTYCDVASEFSIKRSDVARSVNNHKARLRRGTK